MSWFLTNLIASFFLPPLNGLLPLAAGFLVRRRWPRLGWALSVLGFALVLAFSMPWFGWQLIAPLEERYPVLSEAALRDLDVDAVVILGAGRYRLAPEFGGADDVRLQTLDRLRYGADVARQSRKPVLVTGGTPEGAGSSEAEAMRIALLRDFGVTAQWVEEEALNTRQNGQFSARLLLPQDKRRIALVTHAYHMPRSVAVFQAAGFEVVPAPTAYYASRSGRQVFDFIPRYDAVKVSGLALHEWIGLLWYRISG